MAAAVKRNNKGRFKKTGTVRSVNVNELTLDHNYVSEHYCEGECCEVCFPGMKTLINSRKFSSTGWKNGRRIVEWSSIIDALSSCQHCKCGPLYLTKHTVKGEMKLGLGGYLYIQCTLCLRLNRIPYGKTHRSEKQNDKGMPSFCINTKVGAAMIDSVGGPQRMNNLLTTLDLPFINNRSLKTMERRAGQFIEKYAEENMKKESAMAYEKEMIAISQKEEDVKEEFSDLGVAVISDEFHGDVSRLADQSTCTSFDSPGDGNSSKGSKLEQATYGVILDSNKDVTSYDAHRSKKLHPAVKKLSFPPKSRKGMTVCIDHGWQKRGFDSLTGHTFMMSKENKVLKAVVTHRTCGVCKWWKRNRPGVKVREHRCVWNHRGSARAMESEAGLKAIKDMIQEGTPVDVIEGDGDNTLVTRIHKSLGVTVKKKNDRNHCIKNIVKLLYDLRNRKDVKISNMVIQHLHKCIKYVFSKNQGDVDGMRENLQALIPHQFGDHNHCHARFCGYKRVGNTQKYAHRSLPYKAPLSDPLLREQLDLLFEPVIAKSAMYVDLCSSQACEYANRAAMLKAPKHLHYGESESLDFRIHATAASINIGRKYLL